MRYHLGEHLEHVADPHRADEGHGVDRDGDDAALRALDSGDAAGLVHARQHQPPKISPLALVSAGIALMRTVSSPRGFSFMASAPCGIL